MVRVAVAQSLPKRKVGLIAAATLVTLLLVETQSYLMARLSIVHHNPFSFYSSSLFSGLPQATLDVESAAPELGWPTDDTPRSQPVTQPTVCGATFGDP